MFLVALIYRFNGRRKILIFFTRNSFWEQKDMFFSYRSKSKMATHLKNKNLRKYLRMWFSALTLLTSLISFIAEVFQCLVLFQNTSFFKTYSNALLLGLCWAKFPVSLSNHDDFTPRLLYSSTRHSPEGFENWLHSRCVTSVSIRDLVCISILTPASN